MRQRNQRQERVDAFEDMLRRTLQQEQRQDEDDIVIHSVVLPDGREVPILERRSESEWAQDPEAPNDPIPITTRHVSFRLDDTGKSFGSIKNVAACQYGCLVHTKALSVCHTCRNHICRRHTLFVGERTYCRTSLRCSLRARLYRMGRILLAGFHLATGLNLESKSATSDAELLRTRTSSSTQRNLVEEETR